MGFCERCIRSRATEQKEPLTYGGARSLWSAICPSVAGVVAAALAPADSEEREFRGLRRLPRGYRSMRDRARTGDLALKPADDAEPASLRSRRRLGHGKHLQEASGRKLLRISRPDAPRPAPPRYLTFFHTRMDRPSFPSK